MADDPARRFPLDSSQTIEQSAETRTNSAASSALHGHLDYVELTERVALGITVKMPDAAATAIPGTQPLGSRDGAALTEAPAASTLGTNERAAKS
jgi:hypothetical protein